MALSINTTYLVQVLLPMVQGNLDKYAVNTKRYQMHRVCSHATVIHDASTIKRLRDAESRDLSTQEALDWQADQDDDVDEVEVFHYLEQLAKTSPRLNAAFSQSNHGIKSTTLVTSLAVQSPSLTASAQGRPLSSFHHYSLTHSVLRDSDGRLLSFNLSNLQKVLPSGPKFNSMWAILPSRFKIVGAGSTGNEPIVVCHVQYDFVDLLSRRSHPTSRPGKRRRTILNPIHQVSSPPMQQSSQPNHLPEAKLFKGVRYRPERRTWVAEMRPPKYKNKVSFGDFKSQAQAARVIDAAFHFYGRPHLLNFPDTPRILSARLIPTELDEEDKLKFVKEQAKWLASIASTLPSSPPSVPSNIPESWSRSCTVDTSGFRSFSEIASFLSCGDADEADDTISEPHLSLHPNPIAALVGTRLMESDYVGANAMGAIVGTLEEQQGVLQWDLEGALVDPCLSAQWSPGSSVQITDGWDGAEHSCTPALTNLVNSSQSSCESQGWCRPPS